MTIEERLALPLTPTMPTMHVDMLRAARTNTVGRGYGSRNVPLLSLHS